MFIAETQVRVRYAETDQMNVVLYHGNYARYFEVARAKSIRRVSLKDMEAIDCYCMPVVEIHCKFIRPAHYDELLTIKTILKGTAGQSRIEFHQNYTMKRINCLPLVIVVLYFYAPPPWERAYHAATITTGIGTLFSG